MTRSAEPTKRDLTPFAAQHGQRVIPAWWCHRLDLRPANRRAAVAAFDSGNLLAVATALHERWPDKGIMIAERGG